MTTTTTKGLQKLGKQLNSELKFEDIQIECFTINCVEFKSVYFVVEGWFDLDSEGLNNLKKSISNTIQRNVGDDFNKNKIIAYTEFPRTLTDGYGFSMFEYTIYLKNINQIDVHQAKEPTRKIMNKIYEENFVDAGFRYKNLRNSKKRR